MLVLDFFAGRSSAVFWGATDKPGADDELEEVAADDEDDETYDAVLAALAALRRLRELPSSVDRSGPDEASACTTITASRGLCGIS